MICKYALIADFSSVVGKDSLERFINFNNAARSEM